jgi:outer membrane protein assembly factor BamB
MVSFDVSSDAESHDAESRDADDGASTPPAARTAWRARVVDRWRRADRRQRRLAAGVSGGVALVLVGGVATAAALASYTHDERLRASPGGVLSLDGELVEMWSTEAVGGVAAVLPGGGVVLVDGEEVVAWDAASGTERWRAELGPEVVCGPTPQYTSGVEWGLPEEQVTCLHGPADERTVTVLAAAGDVVGQRDLPAAEYGGEHRDVAPAADGGLLVVDHDTDMPAVRDYATESAARAVLDDVEPGDASVRVEDAVTGDVRFEVPTSPHAGMEGCADVWDRSDGARPLSFDQATPFRLAVSPDRLLVSSPAIVGYQWCDVGGAATTVDGTSVAEHGGGGAGTWVWSVEPFPGGGYLVPGDPGTEGTVLLADDGSVRLETSSSTLVVPQASLVAGGDVVLAQEGPQAVVGLDAADGTQLWRHETANPQVLAETDEAVLVVSDEDLVAIDREDGTERWRVTLRGPGGSSVGWPTSAVTDGDRVTVALMVHSLTTTADGEVEGELLTADLATGAVVRLPLDDAGQPYVTAVDGQLLLQMLPITSSPSDEPDPASVSVLAPR